MKGVTLNLDISARELTATVDPLLIDDVLQPNELKTFIESSEYRDVFILENGISALCERSNGAKKANSLEEQTQVVGEVRDAKFTVNLKDEEMKAELVVESPCYGSIPSYEEVIAMLHENGVRRGISKKRVESLLFQASQVGSGFEFTDTVAKGLPPRDGKPSYIKAIFPNALERILEPQEAGNNKVDMRNLGDILCVKANIAVARRVPPSKGRTGFTVSGKPIKSKEGNWLPIKLGANTSISPEDENVIIADVTGQPKFAKNIMTVNDTFQTKGVNVGTGNINYDGAVIVNGDVTESMHVIATGDVTINGFVESANIQADGDIIITEGAMGKMNEEDCKLTAKGSVFVQHGQGLDIKAGKNLNVRKQLAYSRVNCKGKVTIGEPDKPMGSLFASSIQCGSTISAGTVGAVSGSALNIDFSDALNQLNTRYDSLLVYLKQLRENSFDHTVKLRDMKSKNVPSALNNSVSKIEALIESEKHLLDWLEITEQELSQAKVDFEKNAKIVANKELFQGVSVKMNKTNWRSEKEYLKCVIKLSGGKWKYHPLLR
mmetsp:Transcript_60853/g.193068  ORF Transcript_60853/g.193068 Transcript_60853/m.193068 type:complete len:549 (+) Transcript_60853:497-2143(+)